MEGAVNWGLATQVTRPDGIGVRRYIKTLRGSLIEFSRFQSECERYEQRHHAQWALERLRKVDWQLGCRTSIVRFYRRLEKAS